HQEEVIKAAVEVHGAGGPHSRQVQGHAQLLPELPLRRLAAGLSGIHAAGGRHIPCLRPDGLFP
ncbi:Inhibitor of sigma-G Gin, partial [Dysosmobacter welbionis]